MLLFVWGAKKGKGLLSLMTQDERWRIKYNEVMDFIKTNHRNPSRHDPQERYKYLNWMKHNKKLLNAGAMKEERAESFGELVDLWEESCNR